MSETEDISSKANEIYSFVVSHINENECDLISQEVVEIISQIPFLCSKLLENSALNSESDDVQSLSKVIDDVCLCFDAILLCLEKYNVEKFPLSIINSALKILLQSYTHCKDSESIYGSLLEQVATQLGHLFKKTEKIQNCVLKQLNLLNSSDFNEDAAIVQTIVQDLDNLCILVSSLDADFSLELWMVYIKIISTLEVSCSDVNIQLNISDLVTNFLDIIKTGQNTPSQFENEADKISAYINVIVSLPSTSSSILQNNCILYETVLSALLETLILCYTVPALGNSNFEVIRKTLEKRMVPFMKILFANDEFKNLVLEVSFEKSNAFISSLVKIYSLDFLKDSILEYKGKLLQTILDSLHLGTPEDDFKLLNYEMPLCCLCETESQKFETLYDIACQKLTTYLECCPDSIILNLCSDLMKTLKVSSDVKCLLILDAFIFRLRCSSIALLKKFCHSAAQIYFSQQDHHLIIQLLIRRLFKFLPSSEKDKMYDEFCSLRTIVESSQQIYHSYGMSDLISSNTNLFDDAMKLSMLNSKCQQMKIVSDSSERALLSLEICTLLVDCAENKEILLFLEMAKDYFKSENFEVQIAVLTLIKALSKKRFTESGNEFGRIVSCFAHLFSLSINCKNYMVRFEALNTFSTFAKCTPHVKIPQETVRRDSSLKSAIKAYVTGVPPGGFLSKEEKLKYLQEQIFQKSSIL